MPSISRQLPLEAINGALYNTKEKQQSAYDNIQVKGNSLYGVKKQVKQISQPTQQTQQTQPRKIEDKSLTPDKSVFKGISSEPYIPDKGIGQGIVLKGAVPWQQKIADKYKNVYRNGIAIDVLNDLGQANDDGMFRAGVTKFYKNGERTIGMSNMLSPDEFELALIHEVGHRVYGYDEKSADNYAKEIMKMVNSTK